MRLGEIIELLERADPASVCPSGFHAPHSYRGYYDRLAFEPVTNITVGEMLKHAQAAVDETFTGWKGGENTMTLETPCYIAYMGATGTPITPPLLTIMLGNTLHRPTKEDIINSINGYYADQNCSLDETRRGLVSMAALLNRLVNEIDRNPARARTYKKEQS